MKNTISSLRILKLSCSYMLDNKSSEYYIRTRFFCSIMLTVMTTMVNILSPLLLKKAIDLLNNSEESLDVFGYEIPANLLATSYGLSWVMGQMLTQSRTMVMERVIQNSGRNLSLKLIDQLNSLSLKYHVNRQTGSITESINKAQYGMESLLTNGVINIVPLVIELSIATCIISSWYGREYGLSLLGILSGYGIFTSIFTKKSNLVQQNTSKICGHVISRIVENLQNYETIQLFNNKEYEVNACNTLLIQRENALTNSFVMTDKVLMGQVMILGLGLTLLTSLTFNAVLKDEKYAVSDFILINTYLLQFIWPLNQSGYFMKDIRRAINDLRNVFEILNERSDVVEFSSAKALKCKGGEISFKNVSFQYDSNKAVIKNVNITLPSRKKLAIVGRNWSGKSTLAKLLFRFYDPSDGNIYIDGQDIKYLKINSLRSFIGVVPQEIVLFNNTLFYNIKYGAPNVDDDEVYRVIRECQLEEFINGLPDGLNTVVGERGVKLSGGARQLVGIARAVLKKPKIYILDEITSALDQKLERLIQFNLERICKNATVIIIAHRLSTIKNADHIIVMNDGKIEEEGKHEELLARKKLYSQLWDEDLNSSNFEFNETNVGKDVNQRKHDSDNDVLNVKYKLNKELNDTNVEIIEDESSFLTDENPSINRNLRLNFFGSNHSKETKVRAKNYGTLNIEDRDDKSKQSACAII